MEIHMLLPYLDHGIAMAATVLIVKSGEFPSPNNWSHKPLLREIKTYLWTQTSQDNKQSTKYIGIYNLMTTTHSKNLENLSIKISTTNFNKRKKTICISKLRVRIDHLCAFLHVFLNYKSLSSVKTYVKHVKNS